MRLLMVVLLIVTASAAVAEPLPPAEAYRLIEALFATDPELRRDARERLIEANDPSLAAALVEVIFFSKEGRSDAVAVLEHLFGRSTGEGRMYHHWLEQLGKRTDIVPKPGYLAFKARQYARIDPSFTAFFRDDLPRTIRAEEIVFGGVKKDGIPALDRAPVIAADQATYLDAGETVFGVFVDGHARAYPQRILDWHEMANDVVGGSPVSLTYCTLCGAAILYETKVAEGEIYTFGSSGLLYRSNKLMYDRQTNSLWSQLTGEPVVGTLVGKHKKLKVLPLTVTSWQEWKSRHPKTDVLSLETGHRRDYRPGAAYGNYFASPRLMFPVWNRSDARLAAKEWVWIVEMGDRRKAYPLRVLQKKRLLNDAIGATAVVLLSDASGAVRAYARDEHRFNHADTGRLRTRDGEEFVISEEALVSASGSERLPRLPGHQSYWFGVAAFFPGTELYVEAEQ